MLMILILHVLLYGGALNEIDSSHINFSIVWGFEFLCIVAVNCYVLISGYFSINSKLKLDRIIYLWFQIIFYSLIFLAISYLVLGDVNEMKLLNSFFPVTSKAYWFVTSYIGMILLSPVLNIIVHKMTKRGLQYLIICLLYLFVFSAYIIDPYFAHSGMSLVWFITLYIIAAYIRLHINESSKPWKYLFFYLLITIITLFVKLFLEKTEYLMISNLLKLLAYNSVNVLLASLCLFMYFRSIPIKSSKTINYVASYTFAVYLIHANKFFYEDINLFKNIFNYESHYYSYSLIFSVIAISIAVFIVCVLIDLFRNKLFELLRIRRLSKFISERLMQYINLIIMP